MPSLRPQPRKALVIGGGVAGPAVALALSRVGFEVDIFERRHATADAAGAFLNLAPNGVNALRALGVAKRVAEVGFHSEAIRFFNGHGKRVGELDSRNERERYGAENLMVMRGDLHRVLCGEAEHHGAELLFNKELVGVSVGDDGRPTARFADGTIATGDVLVGCDGVHSRVRRHVLPEGVAPEYTGIVDCGGIARLRPGTIPPGIQHMTFGRNAFFGYVARPDGEVWWFSNVPWPQEPERGELEAIEPEAWRRRLLGLHRDDPAPIPEILRAAETVTGKWPLHVMPPLPRWHAGPLCLVGDAAHATPPHAGQGASLALEDAVVLAKSVRDVSGIEEAFATFEALRKERVERIVEQARRTGDQKIPGPVQAWFRDLLLPLFLKLGARQAARTYAYRVDWHESVTPPEDAVPA